MSAPSISIPTPSNQPTENTGVTPHGFHSKPVTPKVKRGLMASVIMISVVVHVVIALVFAAIKVAQAIMEDPVFESPPVVQAQDVKKKEIKKKVEERSRSGGSPPKTVITVDRPTDFSVPKVDVKVNSPNGKLGSRGEGEGLGDGFGNGSGNGIGNGLKTLNFRGVEIQASKLGVVLDVSNSIKPYVPSLRKEIEKNFEDAVVKEVFGCFFTLKDPTHATLPIKSVYPHMVDLIKKDGCDAIYWFSDLQDKVEEDTVKKFSALVRINKVRFYIISVGKEPHPDLAALAKRSGGSVRVDKPSAHKK